MEKLMKKASLVVGLFLIAMMVASCTQQAIAPAPTAAPAAKPTAAPASSSTETLKVGFVLPLTGPIARIGMITERFMRMGLEEVNSKGIKVGGKTYKMEAVSADSQMTSEGGRIAANRLVLNDKVRFVLGSMMPDTPGVQAITEPSKVLTLVYSAPDASLGPKNPLTLEPGNSHIFMRGPALYDFMVKDSPNIKRVALINTDDPMGRSTAGAAEAALKARGLSLLANEFFPPDLKDFSPLATRVVRQQPDIIDIGPLGASPQIFVPLINNLKDQGFKGPIQGTGGSTPVLLDNAKVLDGYVTTALIDWESPLVSERERAIMQKYAATFSRADLEPVMLPAYNLLVILAQAMEKAGTVEDTEKLAQTLRDGEWDNIWGKSRFVGAKTFGLPSVIETPIYLTKLGAGKLVTVGRVLGTLP